MKCSSEDVTQAVDKWMEFRKSAWLDKFNAELLT